MVETALKAALRRVAALAWDHPAPTAGLLLALLAAAAWGVAALRIDFSSASFYGGDDDTVAALRGFQERWGPDDDVLMVVVSATDADLLTRERIERIGRVADALRAVPDVRAVTSVATQKLVPPGATLDEAVPVWDLPSFEPGGPITRDELLARLPYVPLLLSTDARFAAIVVELGFSSDDPDRVVPAVGRINETVRAFDGQGGLHLSVAGVPAIRASFISLTRRDQLILVPASLLLIGLALLWTFRRAHGVIVPAAAALTPLALLLGVMGGIGEPIGLLNQAFFTLIPVLAVSDAVHLLARYHEERAGHGARESLLLAVEHTGLACTLTMATTALAFASLGIGGMPVLRNFGLFAALGIVLAYVTLFIVLPLLVRLTSAATPPVVSGGRWFTAVSGLATRRPVAILVGSLIVGAAAAVAGLNVTVDNRLSSLVSPSHPVRQASARLDESLGGTLSLEVELVGPGQAYLQPWVVNATAAFEDWAATQAGVRAVIGPGRSLEAVAASTHLVLDSPNAVRAGYERLSTLIDPSEVVADDYRRARVSIRVAEPGGRAFDAFAHDVLAEAQATFEPFGIRPTITGTTLVAYRGVNRLGRLLRTSLLSVFAEVAIAILLLFRSARITLLALLPNALPLVVGYGTLGLLGVDLDPLSGTVLAFGLGIAVNDTIHLLARVREGVRAGEALREAIRDTIAHSGRAVTITSLVISGGLAINVLSSFPPLQMLGILGSVVMLTALVFELLLLPALLVLFRADTAMRG